MLSMGSIGMDRVISELCYKEQLYKGIIGKSIRYILFEVQRTSHKIKSLLRDDERNFQNMTRVMALS